jgi:hypothetical protein
LVRVVRHRAVPSALGTIAGSGRFPFAIRAGKLKCTRLDSSSASENFRGTRSDGTSE